MGSKAFVGWALVAVAGWWLLIDGGDKRAHNLDTSSSVRTENSETKSALLPSGEVAPILSATRSRDASPAQPSPAGRERPSTPAETVFVSGNRVALRGGPGTDHPVLDRFDKGRPVFLLEARAKWSRVRDKLTAREGWIANFLLEDASSSQEARVVSTQPKQKRTLAAGLSNAEIAKRIISQSIARYPGSCPCPYNVDRGGRRCGKRSAYSKPGGYAPICYPSDVTPQMIAAFR